MENGGPTEDSIFGPRFLTLNLFLFTSEQMASVHHLANASRHADKRQLPLFFLHSISSF